MKDCRVLGFMVAATLFCVAGRAEEQIPQPSSLDSGDPKRAVAEELELLKRRIKELEKAKRAHEDAARTLNQRLKELETAKLAHERATGILEQRLEDLEAAKIARDDATPEDATGTLKQRIEELEKAKRAHEDATRTIIRQSFAERGSNINDYVTFGGTLEESTFRTEDFAGARESDVSLDTADLDFKVHVNDWVTGSLVLEYDRGNSLSLLPASTVSPATPPPPAAPSPAEPPPDTGPPAAPPPAAPVPEAAVIDRINVREAFISIGNTQRFPLFATVGRLFVPFGTSTGDPVTSSLTLVDPLTIDVFEAREEVVMFGLEMPTPPPPPPLETIPAPIPPLVEPLLFRPLVRKLSTWLCSHLSCYPPPPKPILPTIPPAGLPPFTAAVYLYNGDTFDAGGDHIENMGATLGYQTRGMFSGRRIPWSVDFDVDINNSVFDSNFLQFEYQPFLDQIGYVAGMAGHLKSNLGPIGLVLEWNRAIDDAAIIDDREQVFSIRPGAWQVQLAYQFDFNPSVEVIGAQGTYFVLGYSESQDLAGVTRLIGDPLMPTVIRVGSVPEKRLSVGVGEWVLDGLRVALEYSRNVDYSIAEGGTGKSTDGVFMQLTYEW